MNMKLLPAVIISLLLAWPTPATAQTPSSARGPTVLCELVLKDGSRVFGTVQSETDEEVVLRTQAGAILTARREDIASLRPVQGRIERGEFVRSDLHRTRLLFAPTARSLRKGEVSFGVLEFLAPFVQVGITDRISMGGGTPLVFGWDESSRPFWITPKVQVVRTQRAQAAVGLLHMFNVDGDSAGIAYGVSTFGDTDNAATVGVGMGYADDDRAWIVMGGAEGRGA
jgi:hypothetical protein